MAIVVNALEPKFNLEYQPMDSELTRRFVLPFRLGYKDEFVYLAY